MYRLIMREQVIYGHFRDYLEINNQMQAYAQSKGWAPWTLMAPTVGTMNEVVMESDYAKLDDFERESDQVQTDADFMKLVRAAGEHLVQGSGRTELLQTITETA
jgi:hypothetical protein